MAIEKKRRDVEDDTASKAPKVTKARQEVAKKPSKPINIDAEMKTQLARIARSDRTDYEKRVWTALCQIPKGQYTTYGLLSAYLGSSPRAVGNALRRNPFAPDVPCHRVVATGGKLGGFKGSWPKDGEGITTTEKKSLLTGEGVKITSEGKVTGLPWKGFV